MAADETVAFLLSKGADPDLMNKDGKTALQHAIYSKCSSTIDILAPVTRKGLGGAVASIAFYQTELTPAVEDLLRRSALDQEALRKGVANAAQVGAASMPSPLPFLVAAIICAPANYRVVHPVIFLNFRPV